MMLLGLLLLIAAILLTVIGFVFGDLIIAVIAIVFIVKFIKKKKGKTK